MRGLPGLCHAGGIVPAHSRGVEGAGICVGAGTLGTAGPVVTVWEEGSVDPRFSNSSCNFLLIGSSLALFCSISLLGGNPLVWTSFCWYFNSLSCLLSLFLCFFLFFFNLLYTLGILFTFGVMLSSCAGASTVGTAGPAITAWEEGSIDPRCSKSSCNFLLIGSSLALFCSNQEEWKVRYLISLLGQLQVAKQLVQDEKTNYIQGLIDSLVL